MFATLLGGLPRPPLAEDVPLEAVVDACLDLQAEHGLEPATDGGWSIVPGDVVASWLAAADRADRLVKAVVVGPITSGRRVGDVRRDVISLAEAGCRWIEVHEPGAASNESTDDARARFADAHVALTQDLGADLHLTIAITGGNADELGIDAVLAGAYSSLAVDLIDGPETLLWAARYAAGSKGRGMARVGLATSGSLAALRWEEAATKVRRLGDAARIITLPAGERRREIDPRAVDIRSAALGHVESAEPQPPVDDSE